MELGEMDQQDDRVTVALNWERDSMFSLILEAKQSDDMVYIMYEL